MRTSQAFPVRDAWALGITYQSAAQAKGVVTDKRLKSWGLWVPGQQHARDAIRHAVTYLRSN